MSIPSRLNKARLVGSIESMEPSRNADTLALPTAQSRYMQSDVDNCCEQTRHCRRPASRVKD